MLNMGVGFYGHIRQTIQVKALVVDFCHELNCGGDGQQLVLGGQQCRVYGRRLKPGTRFNPMNYSGFCDFSVIHIQPVLVFKQLLAQEIALRIRQFKPGQHLLRVPVKKDIAQIEDDRADRLLFHSISRVRISKGLSRQARAAFVLLRCPEATLACLAVFNYSGAPA